MTTTLNGTAPFSYNWLPASQTLIEPNGRTVRISVPDNARRPINLTVTDSSGEPACKAFATRYVGTPGFTVSTNPGSGPGRKTGSRDTMEFHVTLKAVADAAFANPPASISFRVHRASAGQTWSLTANRVGTDTPARYEFEWPITAEKGKWEISVEGYPSNTVTALHKKSFLPQ